MLINKVIIFPINRPLGTNCDYALQTIRLLSIRNQVIVLDFSSHLTLKNLIGNYIRRKNKLTHFPAQLKKITIFSFICLIPFIRSKAIYNLNLNLFLFAHCVYQYLKHQANLLIWLQHPQFAHVSLVPYFTIFYDCLDYYLEEFPKNEILLTKKTTFMVTNSHILKKTHAKFRKKITVVPQGFRIETFRDIKPVVGQKIIGYFGGLNYRADFKLLQILISTNPQWQFIFVGEITKHRLDIQYDSPNKWHNLSLYPNVIIKKAVRPNQVPTLMAQIAIGIIPYDKKQNFNRYCYPMKLMEYFYMGKPVISTPIEELKRFPKYVKIGSSSKQWQNHIHSLLKKPWPMPIQYQQRQLAINNNWMHKIEAIGRILNANR